MSALGQKLIFAVQNAHVCFTPESPIPFPSLTGADRRGIIITHTGTNYPARAASDNKSNSDNSRPSKLQPSSMTRGTAVGPADPHPPFHFDDVLAHSGSPHSASFKPQTLARRCHSQGGHQRERHRTRHQEPPLPQTTLQRDWSPLLVGVGMGCKRQAHRRPETWPKIRSPAPTLITQRKAIASRRNRQQAKTEHRREHLKTNTHTTTTNKRGQEKWSE